VSEMEKAVLQGFATGVIGSIVLVLAIHLAGANFGGQCAKQFEWGTPEHKECVHRLATGK
jgi:hypothetical protein